MRKSRKPAAMEPLIDLANPHDGYFKSLMGRRRLAVEFLRLYLPLGVTARFDWQTVERIEDSFISEELRRYFSDLIYRVRLKGGETAYVYILLEHKSAPEKWVALQLLGYKVKLWEQAREAGATVLPLIVPVVFYHGPARWNVSREFSALVAGAEREEWRCYVPNFEYYLFDLSRYADDEIAGSPGLQAGLLLMKYIFHQDLGERLEAIVSRLQALPKRFWRSHLLPISIYTGAAAKINASELEQKLVKAFSRIGEEDMPSPAQTWIQQGIQQGIQQALKQERADLAEMLIHLLHHRLGVLSKRSDAQIRRLSLADLKELGKLVFDFETTTDLAVWLREHNSVRT